VGFLTALIGERRLGQGAKCAVFTRDILSLVEERAVS
jgi:hypothetical protein